MPMLGAVATMATLVVTKDCTALSDADLAEMSECCGGSGRAFEIGMLSKQAEAWVLVTLARDPERDARRVLVLHVGTDRRHAQRADRFGVDHRL